MKFTIIGIGRLGEKIYQLVDKNEYDVVGTYFSKQKDLAGEIFFDYKDDYPPQEIIDSEVMFFNLTPSIISNTSSLGDFLKRCRPKKLIFISSTSVYGYQGIVDEDSPLEPESKSGELLKNCESLVSEYNSLIIRPAGLYGESFHPGQYLSGKTLSYDGLNSVNLISLDDLASLIFMSLESDLKLLNAVNKHHPLKKEYYINYCKRENIDPPEFLEKNIGEKLVKTKHEKFVVHTKLP